MRIEIGRAYQVVAFEGTRRRGRRRIGGYVPRDLSRVGTLHELNVPLLDASPLAALLVDRYGVESAYATAGVFWAFLSLVANSVAPGLAVETVDGRIVPMTDAGIARRLRLPVPTWSTHADRMMAGSGIGVIDYSAAFVDLDDADAAGRASGAREQMSLWGSDLDDVPFVVIDRKGANLGALGAHERNERHGTHEPKRHETATDADLTVGDSDGHGRAGNLAASPAGPAAVSDLINDSRAWIRDRIQVGRTDDAICGYAELIPQALGVRPTPRDAKTVRRAFVAMTSRAHQSRPPSGRRIADRVDASIAAAMEIAGDPDVRNRWACWVAYLDRKGFLTC